MLPRSVLLLLPDPQLMVLVLPQQRLMLLLLLLLLLMLLHRRARPKLARVRCSHQRQLWQLRQRRQLRQTGVKQTQCKC